MKTKKLVQLLLEADPDGEAEVCVGNVDIIDVDGPMPAYYDGQFVQITCDDNARDEHLGGHNSRGVVKVNARCSGVNKINLQIMDAEEAFLDNPEAVFEQDPYNPQRNEQWEEQVKKWRQEGRKLHAELDKMEEEFRAKREKEKAQKG